MRVSIHRYKGNPLSWNSTGKIGRIGRHLAETPDVKVTMCFGPMPPDASDFPGGIPALKPESRTIPEGFYNLLPVTCRPDRNTSLFINPQGTEPELR